MFAAITFVPREPLQLNRRQHAIILKQCGARIVSAGMDAENELRHLFNDHDASSDRADHA